MMKALITGGTGFVGSHLVDKLIEKNFEVYCVIRKTSNLQWLKGKKLNYIESNDLTENVLKDIIEEVDYIFHIAGVVKAKDESGYEKGNYIITKNLINSILETKHNLRKFVFISSQAVCGPNPDDKPIDENYIPKPITTYGRTKLKAEQEVMLSKEKIPVTIIRPCAIFGPRDTEILIYFKTYSKGLNAIIGLKEKYLSLIYIEDLIDGILLAAESDKSNGEIFFLCNTKFYNWDEIARTTEKVLNKRAIKIRIPHFVVYTAGAISQLISIFSKNAATLNLEKCKDITQTRWVCSNKKAREVLGFQEKYTLEEGFKKTVEWYKEQGWLK
ncbi:MAG: NAD(P)-dependent oxidoreductase [Ignavibacteria bacterium]|nr:NAD(P)-dependent oxidoreductase [Ignavibacteria bacterium]